MQTRKHNYIFSKPNYDIWDCLDDDGKKFGQIDNRDGKFSFYGFLRKKGTNCELNLNTWKDVILFAQNYLSR